MNEFQRIPVKFTDNGEGKCYALFPSVIRFDYDPNKLFICSNDVVVKLTWLSISNGDIADICEYLERVSQEFYGISFEKLKSIWYARLKVDYEQCWDKVLMEKVE